MVTQSKKYYNSSLEWTYKNINDIICVFKKDGNLIKTITPSELQDLIDIRMVQPYE